PFTYYADQAPRHSLSTPYSPYSVGEDFPPQALSLSLQMSNVLLLLGFMAAICCWTTREAAVTRCYLLAVALADYGHIYAVYASLGPERFWDISAWNALIWGNVGVSAFLNVNRLLAAGGVFGSVRDVATIVKGKRSK
ncbi:hypothetical protein QBC46DRAFT_270207, partial [Diplogelasinospora grovesii]